MVSRLNRTLQFVRDVILITFSTVVLPNTWGDWGTEAVFIVLDSLTMILLVLSVIDIVLLVKNVKDRKFFYGNAIFQLFSSFLLAGLLPYLGIPLLALNIVIIATLRQKKVRPAPTR